MSETGAGQRPPTARDVSELATRHGLELVRAGYLLCGDRQIAEDLVQDVLLAMYRRFPDGLPLANPVGYAVRALAHAHVSRRRRASNREEVTALPRENPVLRDAVTPAPRPDPGDRDALWNGLRKLPARQRAVLVLRFYIDASDSDIAETLHCRRGTVRSLASRALARLRTDADVRSIAGEA